MTQNTTKGRLVRLETRLLNAGCRTCHDWPSVVFLRRPDDEPPFPARCPDCRRKVIQARIVGVDPDLI